MTTATKTTAKTTSKTVVRMTHATPNGTAYRPVTASEKAKKLGCMASECGNRAHFVDEKGDKYCSLVCLDGSAEPTAPEVNSDFIAPTEEVAHEEMPTVTALADTTQVVDLSTGEPLTEAQIASPEAPTATEPAAPAPDKYIIVHRQRGGNRKVLAFCKTDKEAFTLLPKKAEELRTAGQRLTGSFDTGYVIVDANQRAVGSLYIADIETQEMALTAAPKSDRSAVSPMRLYMSAKTALRTAIEKETTAFLNAPTHIGKAELVSLKNEYLELVTQGPDAYKLPIGD